MRVAQASMRAAFSNWRSVHAPLALRPAAECLEEIGTVSPLRSRSKHIALDRETASIIRGVCKFEVYRKNSAADQEKYETGQAKDNAWDDNNKAFKGFVYTLANFLSVRIQSLFFSFIS